MPSATVPEQHNDELSQARKLAARMISSIDTNTWSIRDIKKSAKKILELLNTMG